MPRNKKYRKVGKRFFAICFCGEEVEGIEELKPGGSGQSGYKHLHFKCRNCRSDWYMDKNRFLRAIHGGFCSGKWIPCNEEGYVIGKGNLRSRKK